MPSLTVKVLERLQAQHPDYQMELVGGEILETEDALAGLARCIEPSEKGRTRRRGKKLTIATA
ncbi:hypothetical protein [Moorena sp. SIO3B2]|uniref:hypothetical protein n=1 Tax=Moorena sp. SIO3B2 TaxID=2607827 RepID=UPI00257E4D56|nr:hypothetical protein [Moorena sp. SIO3B2]